MDETTGATLNPEETPRKPVWNVSVPAPSEYTPKKVTAIATNPLGKTAKAVILLDHRQTPIRKGVSLVLIMHCA
jgi:hypothetical protein